MVNAARSKEAGKSYHPLRGTGIAAAPWLAEQSGIQFNLPTVTTVDAETYALMLRNALAVAAAADHVEARLDEALRETFPASDPIAVSIES